jgi:hypothetical protein
MTAILKRIIDVASLMKNIRGKIASVQCFSDGLDSLGLIPGNTSFFSSPQRPDRL